MSENPSPTPVKRRAKHRKYSPRWWLNRIGCGGLILFWLFLMTLPFFFITLLVNKELTLNLSDVPSHEIRLFTLENRNEQGLGLSWARVYSGSPQEDQVCIRTTTRYLLWEGEGENISYCQCYERSSHADWLPTLIGDENCQPITFDADLSDD